MNNNYCYSDINNVQNIMSQKTWAEIIFRQGNADAVKHSSGFNFVLECVDHSMGYSLVQ